MFLCKPNNYLRMLRNCPKSFIILTYNKKTQHECSISLNLAILFTLLQKKKSTTFLERTKVKHKSRRTNPYFKRVRES